MFTGVARGFSEKIAARKTNFAFSVSFFLDDPRNPYKPTYTFPEEFDGNLELMEDYIRRAASEDGDDRTGTKRERELLRLELTH